MSDFLKQTVDEFLFGPCARSLLSDMAMENEYWEKVEAFVEANRLKSIGELSQKQKDWLFRIKEGLLED